MNNPLSTKGDLRKYAKTVRNSLPVAEIAVAIREQLASLEAIQQANTIALYSPLPGELDLLPMIGQLKEKTWLFPRLGEATQGEAEVLCFHQYCLGDPIQLHAFGMAEPLSEAPVLPETQPIDVMILPALMADAQGYRLGYGKGYYDRFLSHPQNNPVTHRLVAIAEALVVPTLPRDLWDQPVDIIVTEKQIRFPNSF